MIKKLKNYLKIGTLFLAGALSYSGEKFNSNYSEDSLTNDPIIMEYAQTISRNYINNVNKSTPFERAREKYEAYQKSELERILNEDKKQKEEIEKRKFLESYYLSQDSLNSYIKEAYSNVKKWPKEFDKRLFRVLLKQESGYNAHAVSKTGYKGLGQIGSEVYQTFRPEEFEALRDSTTGKIDEHALQKELFNPTKNLELSLEYLDYISKFCAKYDQNWANSDLETKRKKILFAYNAGVGTAKNYDFNPNTEINSKNERLKKLPKENREYAEKIMNAYEDSNIKINLN
jgi:soluble lytic murein transglycosylase-like protein